MSERYGVKRGVKLRIVNVESSGGLINAAFRLRILTTLSEPEAAFSGNHPGDAFCAASFGETFADGLI